MYGGGALLIRVVARRTGRCRPWSASGSPTPYGRTVVTQLLFNPSYHGLELTGAVIQAWRQRHADHQHPDPAHGLERRRVDRAGRGVRTQPAGDAVARPFGWLSQSSCSSWDLRSSAIRSTKRVASWRALQLACGVAAVAVLVAVAFTLPRDLRPSRRVRPGPWLVLTAAFVATSLFMALLFELLPGWPRSQRGRCWSLCPWPSYRGGHGGKVGVTHTGSL